LEDESENDEDYLKESFFRLFDINPTKKQVQRKTSPRDYSPKGQNEETKKFIGT
jgi:hypothetical protein